MIKSSLNFSFVLKIAGFIFGFGLIQFLRERSHRNEIKQVMLKIDATNKSINQNINNSLENYVMMLSIEELEYVISQKNGYETVTISKEKLENLLGDGE